jgi:sulfate adenylyltransferase subunit 1 (EFTu-like GTPase family)
LPVQWVNRPSADFRGFSGLIASGRIWPGDRVRALPSGKESRVSRIVTTDGDLELGMAGQSITLVLADEIDVSRGDMLVPAAEPASVGASFEAKVLWMAEAALRPGQSYLLKLAAKTVGAALGAPIYRLEINDHGRMPAETLGLNEIGLCRVRLDQAIAFDAYRLSRETGGFILIDRESNDTVAMGFIERALDGGRPGLEHAVTGRSEPRQRLSSQFAKALSWRVVGTLATMALVYAFTADLGIALALGAIEAAVKTILNLAHERVWARVGLGRRTAAPAVEDDDRQAPARAG